MAVAGLASSSLGALPRRELGVIISSVAARRLGGSQSEKRRRKESVRGHCERKYEREKRLLISKKPRAVDQLQARRIAHRFITPEGPQHRSTTRPVTSILSIPQFPNMGCSGTIKSRNIAEAVLTK